MKGGLAAPVVGEAPLALMSFNEVARAPMFFYEVPEAPMFVCLLNVFCLL